MNLSGPKTQMLIVDYTEIGKIIEEKFKKTKPCYIASVKSDADEHSGMFCSSLSILESEVPNLENNDYVHIAKSIDFGKAYAMGRVEAFAFKCDDNGYVLLRHRESRFALYKVERGADIFCGEYSRMTVIDVIGGELVFVIDNHRRYTASKSVPSVEAFIDIIS